MKDNNTYTGDGDDLDLVTLEKTNREREKKRERDLKRNRVDKNKKKKQKGKRKEKIFSKREIDSVNNLIAQMHREAKEGDRERERERGTYSTHTVIESENNPLENKQSCHSNKYNWPEIQQQYTAGRDRGVDPASKKNKKKQPQHYNKAFYGKVRQVHSRLTGTLLVDEKGGPERVSG